MHSSDVAVAARMPRRTRTTVMSRLPGAEAIHPSFRDPADTRSGRRSGVASFVSVMHSEPAACSCLVLAPIVTTWH